MKVVAAIILNEDKVFITKRPMNKKMGGLWEFPGGKVEEGEKLEEALKREIKEELNAIVYDLKSFMDFTHKYNFSDISFYVYKGKIKNIADIRLLEHMDGKWVEKNKLKVYDFVAADSKIIEKLLKE
jgi:8-oxo-dGTP diphosphatase